MSDVKKSTTVSIAMGECIDPAKRRTIERALALIADETSVSGLLLKHSNGLLTITLDGTERVLIDGHAIPCFEHVIPGFMIGYVVSQLTDIARSAEDPKSRRDALIRAMYNIEARLLTLHVMSERFHAVRATGRRVSHSSHGDSVDLPGR